MPCLPGIAGYDQMRDGQGADGKPRGDENGKDLAGRGFDPSCSCLAYQGSFDNGRRCARPFGSFRFAFARETNENPRGWDEWRVWCAAVCGTRAFRADKQ